ncbi:flagellin N-terminal helical domain-containing protein [Roseinatronobacter sp.]|uniref:flagellin N-terminal helical domain-containing protein n=1 Tax=Roseinatronobacter sp. TaxID=1945755 RepID=UPI003F727D6A
MTSILTNNSAMNALTTLRNINNNLGTTQDRISTGLKVASGKDNAAYFSISSTMKGDSGMIKSIDEGLALTKNAVSTARLGAETVADLAREFVERVAFAQGSGVDLEKVQLELDALAENIEAIVSQSTFNGASLVQDGDGNITAVTGISRDATGAFGDLTTITIEAQDLEAIQTALAAIDVSAGGADLEDLLSDAEEQLKAAVDAATSFGVSEKAIETQQTFLGELSNRLDSGIGSMIDADMEEEAARLQALQVQQQLATQALSIANQGPQNILSLFR